MKINLTRLVNDSNKDLAIHIQLWMLKYQKSNNLTFVSNLMEKEVPVYIELDVGDKEINEETKETGK